MRKILIAAAALAGVLVTAHPSSARPLTSPSFDSPTGTTGQLAGSFHAFSSTGFSGPDAWFYGNTGECRYVGSTWNDRIRSARTESATRVELWDHANCTGGAIVIDSSGYSSIGAWVSAYRVIN
ncbi:peptidase inhibitor family I36 protein [Streptomyces sp. Act-28]